MPGKQSIRRSENCFSSSKAARSGSVLRSVMSPFDGRPSGCWAAVAAGRWCATRHDGCKYGATMTAAESFPRIEPGTEHWIDVTVPIRSDMVHYPGDPGVELRHAMHLDRGDPATVSHLSFGVHTGTHV